MTLDAPTVPELIDVWQEALDDLVAVCTPLDDAQWAAMTPCPGWRAGDIPAHAIDIESLLAGLPRPDHTVDTSVLPHVRNDVGTFTEIGIDYRRGWPKEKVLGELREVIGVRRAQLDAIPEGAEVRGPFGNLTSMDRLLRMRTFDVWAHEQDVRAAAGTPGGWTTPPAQISLQQMLRGLPIIWSRTVGAPEGSTLRVQVTGDLTADVTVTVDGEGKGSVTESTDAPTVGLQVAWPDFMRLCCGRVPADDADLRAGITLSGDADLGEALLPALSMTP